MTTPPAATQAAAEPITDLPNLRIHWRRAVRYDRRLSTAEVMVFLELEDHANLDGTSARPGRDRLAERSIDHGRHRGPYTVRTVTAALKRGRELGYIIRTEESRKLPDGRRTADVYRIALPADVLALAEVPAAPDEPAPADDTDTKQTLGGSEPDLGGSPDFPPPDPFHQTPFKNKNISGKTSVAAAAATEFARPNDSYSRKWKTGETTPGARTIHPQWAPNNANRSVAAELGMDVDLLAEVFHDQMGANGERRRTWGKAFTAFLRDYADNYRSETSFGFIDHALIEEAISEKVQDSVTKHIATVKAEEAAAIEAGHSPAPPPPAPEPTITPKMAETLRKAEKMVGGMFDSEREFITSLLEANPSLNFSYLAGEVDRLRESTRESGRVA